MDDITKKTLVKLRGFKPGDRVIYKPRDRMIYTNYNRRGSTYNYEWFWGKIGIVRSIIGGSYNETSTYSVFFNGAILYLTEAEMELYG